MKDLLKISEQNDLRYYGLLQESANNWRAEMAEVKKQLKDYENNPISKVTRQEASILVDRFNVLNKYLSEVSVREPEVEARVKLYNNLIMGYAD